MKILTIKNIVFASLLLLAQLASATEKVVVLTSYPQQVLSQFEAAFEAAYPQYRLEILWKQSKDAMSYLHRAHEPVDVYWTPAQRNFALLTQEGVLSQLDINLEGLPKTIGGFQISDSEGYYVATEVAGYGVAYHPKELGRLGLPTPVDWTTLTLPAYNGHVVFPVPSKVGYAPMMVDTILQGYGWEEGWRILKQVAANAKLADAGATFISDDVGSGSIAAGATIDFFAVSAIANGKPLKFAYPEKVGYSPAHLGIFNESKQKAGAKAFATFVLSEAGQKILFHPDIRKLPVRPSVYASKPDGYFDPYSAAKQASYNYDLPTGLARQDLVSALFDSLITRPHGDLKMVWEVIHRAELKSPNDPKLKEAVSNANWLPMNEAQTSNPATQQLFINRDKNTIELEQAWDVEVKQHYALAIKIAKQIAGE